MRHSCLAVRSVVMVDVVVVMVHVSHMVVVMDHCVLEVLHSQRLSWLALTVFTHIGDRGEVFESTIFGAPERRLRSRRKRLLQSFILGTDFRNPSLLSFADARCWVRNLGGAELTSPIVDALQPFRGGTVHDFKLAFLSHQWLRRFRLVLVLAAVCRGLARHRRILFSVVDEGAFWIG